METSVSIPTDSNTVISNPDLGENINFDYIANHIINQHNPPAPTKTYPPSQSEGYAT